MRISKEAVLGFLFLAGLAGLAVTTIALTDVTLRRRPRLSVFFQDAKFLKKGDPVYVAGVRSGRVKEVRYDPAEEFDRRVRILLELDSPVTLREDYQIEILESTLLGGRVVSVEPGPPESRPLPERPQLRGRARAEHLAALNELIEENKEDIRRLFGAAARVVERVDRGEGSLGVLLRDDAPVRELTAAFAEVRAVVADARAGRGTLGQLLSDDALYADAREVASGAKEIVARIESGEGTLGAILTRRELLDSALSFLEDARGASASVGRLAAEIEAGTGTVGRLLRDPALYESWTKVGEDLRAIASTLREGRGTLGKLLTDEEFLGDLRTALKSVTRQIEDARESAPLATFAGFLFGVL